MEYHFLRAYGIDEKAIAEIMPFVKQGRTKVSIIPQDTKEKID